MDKKEALSNLYYECRDLSNYIYWRNNDENELKYHLKHLKKAIKDVEEVTNG